MSNSATRCQEDFHRSIPSPNHGLINTTPTVAGWSISGSNAPSDVIQVLQRDRLISRGLLCSTRLRTSVKASLSSVPTITFFSQERRSHPFSTSIQVSSQTCSVVWSTGDIVIVRSVDARCHLLQQSELRPSDIWWKTPVFGAQPVSLNPAMMSSSTATSLQFKSVKISLKGVTVP